MALNQDLVAFVKEGLQRGLARADIEAVLLRAGWPPEQVRRALAGFADFEFAIPVPRPIPTVSAREAFMYVLMFATLFVSAYNLGDLLFDIIDRRYSRSRLITGRAFTLQSIRWALSRADRRVSHLPVDGLVDRTSGAGRSDQARLQDSPAADLHHALCCGVCADRRRDHRCVQLSRGRADDRFVLKVSHGRAIAGTAFGYYLSDLRVEEKEPET